MNNILKFALILFLVNLVAASILAGVYTLTRPRIEEQERAVQLEALKQVMPESVGDRLEPMQEGEKIKYWKVFKGAGYRPSGYIFVASRYGYSSVIETMVGMKSDGTITGVRILNHNETPGLGSKIIEVLSNKTILKALRGIFSKEESPEVEGLPYFTEQFKGLNVKNLTLSKNGLDAITGATISSKACMDSIRSKGLEILNAEQ